MTTKTFKSFYLKTIRFDIINKFPVKNTKNVSKIKKVILNFDSKPNNIKDLAISLLALEFVTQQKSRPVVTNKSNLDLKIRKGNPVGCKVTLRKNNLLSFMYEMLVNVFPQLKNFEGLQVLSKRSENTFTYIIQDMFNFKELENNYYLFRSLSNVRVTIVAKAVNQNQLFFILKSFKLPFLVKP
uniref:Ribosomal protein L5 n=1 Tax=Proschkinia sp. SZCZR1824 TaxID=2588390 RepID=A0A4Y5SE00_9STRA|nr:ribosomal protein L5 [Proschkinia sp. SZCZR1824]